MKSASDSDLSENAGVDSVAVAPADEFTSVSTLSGDKPRGWQTWRTIVGMVRVISEPIEPSAYVHPARCEAERWWAYFGGKSMLLHI